MNYNTFKFFTNTLKAVKNDDARYIIGIASSTALDRDGDRMSEAALQTMKSTAEANLTIFTNHEYKVPDDLFGSCTEATIKATKDAQPIVIKSEDGMTEVATFSPQQMEVKIKVVSDAVNPKAGQLYKAIEEGVNLGFSIGGVVKKAIKVIDDSTQKVCNLIDSIELYEISVVSIPANPEAMNLAIAKSLNTKTDEKVNKDEIVEIIKKIEDIKPKEVEYTLEGVHKFLLGVLKGMYDEAYPAEPVPMSEAKQEEIEDEMESEDKQRAKAQAENILMCAGISVKVDSTDDHTIHLRSHTFNMEDCMAIGKDVSLQAKHIQEHLKRLKKEVIEDEKEESITE
jgi:hypothetical protein